MDEETNRSIALLVLAGTAVLYPLTSTSTVATVFEWIALWTLIFILFILIEIESLVRQSVDGDNE